MALIEETASKVEKKNIRQSWRSIHVSSQESGPLKEPPDVFFPQQCQEETLTVQLI